MERLEYKTHSGLQIVCSKCGKAVHKNIKTYNGCKHPIESQSYKLVLPDPDNVGKRRTKKLSTKNLNEAIAALVEFKEELNSPFQIVIPVDSKPMLLLDCMQMYIDFKHNVGVPHHKQRNITKAHLNHIESYLMRFPTFLKNSGVNVKLLGVDKVTDDIVGKYHDYLSNQNYSPVTFNTYINHVKFFYNYLINNKDYLIKNPFKGIKSQVVRPLSVTLRANDFYDLLDVITPEDCAKPVGKNGELKTRYRPWLKDFIRLSAYSGRRRAELTQMKWNWIVCDEQGYPIYISSPDIKVNKLQENRNESTMKKIYVPIIQELKELLMDLGYNEKKGTNEYIIALDDKMNRETLEGFATKSFSYYFDKLNRGYSRSLKHLRKTYITKLDFASSGLAQMITQHSSQSIIESNYKDHIHVATQIAKSNFRVFEKRELLINKI